MPTISRQFMLVAILLGLAGPGAPARGADAGATDWVTGFHSRVRLVAAGRHDGALLIGVQLDLDEGWKTYWRTPGDAGLPPEFDWSGSSNLKSARVLWPAPRRFKDASGTYAGYAHGVIFPVLLAPVAAGGPVDVVLKLQYAICEAICVPAEAELRLEVSDAAGAGRELVLGHLNRVPKRSKVGSEGLPRVASVTAALSATKPHLIVEAQFPKDAAGADLLVEGPDGAYVPPPKKLSEAGGEARFSVDLGNGLLAEARGKALTFTLVSDQGQSEVTWTLPAGGS